MNGRKVFDLFPFRDTEKVITCVEACPSGKYVTLAREVHRIFNKYCADGADQAAKESKLDEG